ncbi:hypothetical protein IJH72_02835 [Candidatus Saccharibacteria bacterium]|nr:hypothetical protein [Candidatus Saccharibacteria bacterium]
MKKTKLLVATIGFGFLSIMNGINVMAEDVDSSLTVSPPNQEIILMPGETYEGTIVVSNSNEAKNDLDYSVSIGSFSQKQNNDSIDDYGTVDTEAITSYNQMMEWITLGKESGTVAPNQSDSIPFVITVPSDAPAGGQYATILVQDDSSQGDPEGNVKIESKTRIASIIYAEVTGETKEVGSISENNVPSFLFTNKLSATSVVRNDGNVHTNAKYILQVWPLFGDEEICTNEEKPSESLVMPETEKFHAEECDLPSIGIFRAKQTVKIFGEESVLEKTVVVCPLWLLFLIIFAIILIVMWLIMKSRTRKKD